MTYRINQIVAVINCPVITVIDGKETYYDNGKILSEAEFDKYYIITAITAKNDTVILELKENTRENDITWIGEEAI